MCYRLTIRRFIMIIFSMFFLSSCLSIKSPHVTIIPDRYRADSLPGAEDYPEAGAIILLDEAVVDIFTGKQVASSQIKRKLVVKILNEKGFKYANLTIPYSNHRTQILNLKATTILPDGTKIPLRKKFIFDVNLYPSFILYADIRAKRLTMPSIEPGCIVEYQWEEITKAFTYWTSFYFQHDEPTLLSRYVVRSPSEWKIKWKTYGIDIKPKSKTYPAGFKMTRIWEARNLPPFITETGMPPGRKDVPHIMFSPVGITKWDQISGWYHQLAKERMHADQTIIKKVKEITSREDTPKEKMKKIFEWVRDHIRYVAIEIGIGGFQPYPASQVFKNRFGDCKDMVTLLIAMGRSASINIDPVLLPTWSRGKLDTSLVSHAHFNHAIAVATFADSTKIWMDPTDKDSPYGELPWYDRNQTVLHVNNEGKAIIEQTPQWNTNKNIAYSYWKFKIDTAYSIRGQMEMTFSGSQGNIIRKQLQPLHPQTIKRWMGRTLLNKIPGANLINTVIDNEYHVKSPIIFRCEFAAPRFLNTDFNPTILPLSNLTNFEFYTYFPENERRYDVEIGYPFKDIDFMEIQLPDSFQLPVDKLIDSLKCDFGSYYLTIDHQNKGTINIHREVSIDSTHIDRTKFKEFKKFLNQIAQKDRLMLNIPVKLY